jgi:type IV pilus assembly protein PilX
MQHTRMKQRGAALVIGLILLVVITLLAVVGMNVANTELASATSEQLRLRAFNAAETGIEARMQTLADDATVSATPVTVAAAGVENSPRNTFSDTAADTFSTVTTYRGEGSMLSRYSAGVFLGFHYSVESTGRSVRNAESVHTAGAVLIRGIAKSGISGPLDPDAAPEDAPPEAGLGEVNPYVPEPVTP